MQTFCPLRSSKTSLMEFFFFPKRKFFFNVLYKIKKKVPFCYIFSWSMVGYQRDNTSRCVSQPSNVTQLFDSMSFGHIDNHTQQKHTDDVKKGCGQRVQFHSNNSYMLQFDMLAGKASKKNKHHMEKASNILLSSGSSAVSARFCAPTGGEESKKKSTFRLASCLWSGTVTEMFQAC